MSQNIFTETDRENLKNIAAKVSFFIENKLKFALRIPITPGPDETFVITTSAHSNDKFIYSSLDGINLNVKDGGFF